MLGPSQPRSGPEKAARAPSASFPQNPCDSGQLSTLKHPYYFPLKHPYSTPTPSAETPLHSSSRNGEGCGLTQNKKTTGGESLSEKNTREGSCARKLITRTASAIVTQSPPENLPELHSPYQIREIHDLENS